MHGWAQERLQIYLRSLDKVKESNEVKKSTEPATRIGRGRKICAQYEPCSGISAVASLWRAPKLEERKVVSGPAPENSAPSLERRV
jgi:hypothetical protein